MKKVINSGFLISFIILISFPAKSDSETFTYDELGRVIKVDRSSKSTSYTYDDADNRKSKIISSSSSSQPPSNNSPSCNDVNNHMSTVPTYAGPVSITLQESSFLNLCSDPDGDPLSVTSPSTPHSFTVSSGQTVNVDFTVSDGNGGTGSGRYTFSRP